MNEGHWIAIAIFVIAVAVPVALWIRSVFVSESKSSNQYWDYSNGPDCASMTYRGEDRIGILYDYVNSGAGVTEEEVLKMIDEIEDWRKNLIQFDDPFPPGTTYHTLHAQLYGTTDTCSPQGNVEVVYPMRLDRCEYCGQRHDRDALECPKCGAPV